MASIYKCNGKTIRPGQQFVDADGTTHPGSWYTYSVEQKTALGITEIVQQPHPNSVLYNWGYNDDGTVTSTAKALDDINEVDENGDPRLDDDGVQVVKCVHSRGHYCPRPIGHWSARWTLLYPYPLISKHGVMQSGPRRLRWKMLSLLLRTQMQYLHCS